MIYLVILFILLFLAIQYDANGIKFHDYSIYWGVCAIFILLAGLRYRVGGDTIAYMEYYKEIPPLNKLTGDFLFNHEYQPLWVVFNSFCKLFSDSFTVFQFLHAAVINITIFSFIKRNTEYPFAAILFYFLFYFFYFNMEILRESLGVVVFLMVYKAFLKEKWILYYLGATIAFFFHISAIILIVFPLLRKKVTFTTFLIVLILLAFLFSFFRDIILDTLLNYVTNERLRWAAITYLRAQININGIIFILMGKVLTPLALLYISEVRLGYKPEIKTLLYAYIILSLISIFIEPFYRFTNYLTPIYYLFIVNMFHQLYASKLFFRTRQIVVAFLLLILLVFQFYSVFKDTSDREQDTRFVRRWVPYHSVFSEKMDMKRERLIETYNEN